MYAILLTIHVIVCISLVISVLLQSSKGGGLGGAFGGGTSDTLFGGEGASSFLKKATKVLGITFMTITVLMALSSDKQMTKKSTGTISKEVQEEIEKSKKTEQPTALPEGFERLKKPKENKPK